MPSKRFNAKPLCSSIRQSGSNKQGSRYVIPNCPAANKAFSLIEMLMALLVASLLLAALAPVITKRFSENINVAGATGGGHAPAVFKCWDYDSPELVLASDGSNYKVLPEPYPVDDAWVINFIVSSGGGGGAGATIPNETNHELKSTDSNPEIPIEATMDEIDIVSMIGGGAGGGGGSGVFSSNTCTGSPSETKCECMGQKYDPISKVCVSSNIGQNNRSNAISACNTVTPSGKWTLPNTTQLANWNTNAFYNNLGITSGETAWSKDTTACQNPDVTTYSCTCNGTTRTGYPSADSCCTGCSYGTSNNISYSYCGATPPSNWSSTGAGLGNRGVCGSGGRYPQYPFYCICAASYTSSDTYCRSGLYGGCRTNCDTCMSLCSDKCGGYIADTCASTVTSSTAPGSSCGTYYHFYSLSGSSWVGTTNNTSDTVTRSTYCVYSDSADVTGESFYSLSGGGGGGAPAIQNNGFNSNILTVFRQKVKENVGGYLALEKGLGGTGGLGSSSKNQKAKSGEKGGDSCISIKDSSRRDKFKLCVSGGKSGGAADATVSNAATAGWGQAGGETAASNSCYTLDYTTGSEVRTDFDCTLKGKAGGPGGASASNPTAGGKGAASVLNNIQAGGTAVKDGVSASSANYGAGGGGGSATKTGFGSSATLAFGNGGRGADGYISIKYKKKFVAAGGGGGGGGYTAHIKKINVGKTATCSIKVGYGGPGGSAGAEGNDGGESSVSCSNAPTVSYTIFGGKGGKTGTPEEGGKGGAPGGFNDTGNIFTRLQAEGNLTMLRGLEGKQGGSGDSANFKELNRSAGGRGGTSGTGEKGKCGALYNETGVCAMVSADSNNNIPEPVQNDTRNDLNGLGFTSGGVTIPTKNSIVEATPKFGSAGAGGGGGAWYVGKNSGSGGQGQGGYVCIYWDKLE